MLFTNCQSQAPELLLYGGMAIGTKLLPNIMATDAICNCYQIPTFTIITITGIYDNHCKCTKGLTGPY